MYRIEYYEGDGHSSPPEEIDRNHWIHGRKTLTLREARHLIRLRAKGRGKYGQWSPGFPAVTAYHESRRDGCGGFIIINEDYEYEDYEYEDYE